MTTEQKLAAISAGAAVIAAFLAAGIYLGFLEGRIASLNGGDRRGAGQGDRGHWGQRHRADADITTPYPHRTMVARW